MGRAALAVSHAAGVNYFFFGSLCHAPLLDVVLGRKVVAEAAVLPGRAVFWAEGQAFPVMVLQAGAAALGVVVRDLAPQDNRRLEYYAGSFVTLCEDVEVRVAAQAVAARVFVPDLAQWQVGAPWMLADWQARFGATAVATAGDFMAQFGVKPGAEVRARYGAMLARGRTVRARCGIARNWAMWRRWRGASPMRISLRWRSTICAFAGLMAK
jgi:ADP-ribose pyrophosphatase